MPYDIHAKEVESELRYAISLLMQSNTDFNRNLVLERLKNLHSAIENSEDGVITYSVDDKMQSVIELAQRLRGMLGNELKNPFNQDVNELFANLTFNISPTVSQRAPVSYEQLLPNSPTIQYNSLPQSTSANITNALRNAAIKYTVYESMNQYLDAKSKNPQPFLAEENDHLRTNKIIYKKNDAVYLVHRDPNNPDRKVEPLKLGMENSSKACIEKAKMY